VSWSIRPTVPQDVQLLLAIDTLVSVQPWTQEQFLAGCGGSDGQEQSLLVENSATVAGFVVYISVLEEGSIHNIAVHPLQQRQGLARMLLLEAMNSMEEQGANRCLLDVRESNIAARGLYSSMGFQSDGIRKNYYRSGDKRENALLMSRLLGE
jgi:ribosomal-protein-alanine N-acetyltransferase